MPLKTLTIINNGKDTIQNIAFNKKGSLNLLNYYKMVDDWSYKFMFPHVTREVFRVSHLAYKNVRVYKQLDKERILAQTYRKDNIPIGSFRSIITILSFLRNMFLRQINFLLLYVALEFKLENFFGYLEEH